MGDPENPFDPRRCAGPADAFALWDAVERTRAAGNLPMAPAEPALLTARDALEWVDTRLRGILEAEQQAASARQTPDPVAVQRLAAEVRRRLAEIP